MSIYPPPSSISDVFHPDDYADKYETTHTGDVVEAIDHSTYLTKSGGTLTGSLSLPSVHFLDLSQQTTAFTSTINNKVNQSETDVLALKQNINSNTSTLTLTSPNSTLPLYVNSQGVHLSRGALNYGSILPILDGSDAMHVSAPNNLQLSCGSTKNLVLWAPNIYCGNGSCNLRLGLNSKLLMNGETQNYAYTDADRAKLQSWATPSISPFVATSLQIGSGIQNFAYTDADRAKLQAITTPSTNPFVVTSLQVNGQLQSAAFTSAHQTSISTTATTVANHATRIVDNELDISQLVETTTPFTTNYDSVKLDRRLHFGSAGTIAAVSSSFYIYSLTNSMILHTGSFPLVAWAPQLQVGNDASGGSLMIRGSSGYIVLRGLHQNVAFTDTRVAQLDSATSSIQTINTALQNLTTSQTSRILLHFKRNDWLIVNRTTPFAEGTGYNTLPILNIFTLDEFTPYRSTDFKWNSGTKRITFKFNVAFLSYGSAVVKFCSRFRLKRAGTAILGDDCLYAGVHHNMSMDFHHTIQYGDSYTVDIQDGDELWLETKVYVSMEFNRSFDMHYTLGMVEV